MVNGQKLEFLEPYNFNVILEQLNRYQSILNSFILELSLMIIKSSNNDY